MRKLAILAALALTASPAFAAGGGSSAKTSAQKQCRTERTAMGTQTFRDTYGTNKNKKNAFGKCVSKTASAQSHNESAASASCRSQQDADQAGFDQKFTNFGACVSTAANQASTAQQQSTIAAAKQCASQLKTDAKAFHSKYRTFGACVSQTAHA